MASKDNPRADSVRATPRRAQEEVRVPKAAEIVAARLRRRIITGELAFGEHLGPETELLSQYGVSRPTLREAFRILETESLIKIVRGVNGGVVVIRPRVELAARYYGLLLALSGTPANEVYQAMAMIEPPAAGLLATKDPLRSAETLTRRIDEERRSIDDPKAYARASTTFHETLIELTGNRALLLFAQTLREIIEQTISGAIHGSGAPTTNARRKGIRAHEELVALIAAGKREEAEAYWARHLAAAGNALFKDREPPLVLDFFTGAPD
jgi:DNA-binding FadR family transcriptional regulator